MPQRTLLGIAILALAATVAGAGEKKKGDALPAVLTKLMKAKTIQLLSLDPDLKQKDGADGFHGWKVLGSTTLIDKKKDKPRSQVLNAVIKGVKDSNGDMARCFIPRHGIAAMVDKQAIELVICFQCLQIEAFVNGKPLPKKIATTATAGPVLNSILIKAKVQLPKQPK